MLLDLTDEVVLVTGAARGIGRVIADRFAQEGSRVVALDLARVPPGADAGAGVLPLVCDVSDSASVRAAVAEVVERYGRVDVLVNNAGINAASFAAIVPSVGSAAYAASKAAVVQLTRVLASELGPWDITVNSYAPGMIPTAMNGFAEMEPAAQDRLLDTLSLRRWGRAEDVADLVAFLASDAAGYITGALVDVSGGKLATQIPRTAYEGAQT